MTRVFEEIVREIEEEYSISDHSEYWGKIIL